MNLITPDHKQEIRPQPGFCSLHKDLLVSKVNKVVARPPPCHAASHRVVRKGEISPVGIKNPGMSRVLNLPTLTQVCSSAAVPL